MNKEELLAIFDREQRIDIEIPGLIHEATVRVVRDYDPVENFNFISYSSLDAQTADAEIEAQVAYHQARGIPLTWKVYDHDQPADLRQRLASRGFSIEQPEALVVLDIEEAPDWYWSLELPAKLVKITDAAGVAEVTRMEEDVWQSPRDRLRERLTRNLEKMPDLMDIFAVREDGRVVSAAWVYYHPPTHFASFWGGSTLPGYRKRGYYTALLAVRARSARQRGFRFLTVDASPMSRPILEKHGFQFLGFSTDCNWKPETDH